MAIATNGPASARSPSHRPIGPWVVAAFIASAGLPAAHAQTGCPLEETFNIARDYRQDASPRTPVIADFDRDGLNDIATTLYAPSADAVSVMLAADRCDFRLPQAYGVGTRPSGLAAGDLDGDGWPDLVASNSESQDVSILFNDRSGGFGLQVRRGVGVRPFEVMLADIDTDGDLDIWTANLNDRTIGVLLNDGAGSFTPGPVYDAGEDPRAMIAADFTGDGLPDIAVANTGAGQIRVFENDGVGGFSQSVWDVGNRVFYLDAADFDLDGDLDIVSSTLDDGSIRFLYNNGDGTFDQQLVRNVGTTLYGIRAGDFTGDGLPDVGVVDSTQGRVHLVENDLSPTLGAVVSFDAGAGAFSMAAGNLSGGDRLDLVVANEIDGTVSVLLSRCDAVGTILEHPASQLLEYPGRSGVRFTVVVAGSAEYQWHRGGIPLDDGSGVSGTRSETLRVDVDVTRATAENVGEYDVVVTTPRGSVTSESAVLAVRPNPCPGDIDGDGELTIFDFLAFQTLFGSGCP
ncbi:MAG: FG-GAP-like repeat-containing protein [Phycisphaera sp.]|nr:MAG: FG-GAP-like repeat-containing protein [Phycisphaera sp.]